MSNRSVATPQGQVRTGSGDVAQDWLEHEGLTRAK